MNSKISIFESHIFHHRNQETKFFNVPKGWCNPVPEMDDVDDVLLPELEKSKVDDVDVTKLLESFGKKVKEFVTCKENVLDVLVLFLYKTESKNEFEMGLSLLREGIEAGGKIDPATPSFLAIRKDVSGFVTTIQAMTDYPSFASVLLENVAFRRSFWALACHWIEQDKLLDRCVGFVSNREPDVNVVHPVLHIVAYLESSKHSKKALALMDAVNKSVSNQSGPTSISLLLLRQLFGSDVCNGRVSDATAKSVLELLTRLASYTMSASELRSWIVCVLQCRWHFRSVSSGKDEISQGHPHAMCNQVVRSLLEATRSTLRQCGQVFDTSEIRFATSGSLNIDLSAFDRRQKKQPVILRGWPNSSSFTVSLWFRVFERKDSENRVLYRFINSSDTMITECSVSMNRFKLCVGDDIVRFEVNDSKENSWRHLVVVRIILSGVSVAVPASSLNKYTHTGTNKRRKATLWSYISILRNCIRRCKGSVQRKTKVSQELKYCEAYLDRYGIL